MVVQHKWNWSIGTGIIAGFLAYWMAWSPLAIGVSLVAGGGVGCGIVYLACKISTLWQRLEHIGRKVERIIDNLDGASAELISIRRKVDDDLIPKVLVLLDEVRETNKEAKAVCGQVKTGLDSAQQTLEAPKAAMQSVKNVATDVMNAADQFVDLLGPVEHSSQGSEDMSNPKSEQSETHCEASDPVVPKQGWMSWLFAGYLRTNATRSPSPSSSVDSDYSGPVRFTKTPPLLSSTDSSGDKQSAHSPKKAHKTLSLSRSSESAR